MHICLSYTPSGHRVSSHALVMLCVALPSKFILSGILKLWYHNIDIFAVASAKPVQYFGLNGWRGLTDGSRAMGGRGGQQL